MNQASNTCSLDKRLAGALSFCHGEIQKDDR